MSLIEPNQTLDEIRNIIFGALNKAGNDSRSAFRFIIFNTIADGFPNSRYVVLRKFDIQTKELSIYTDSRSNKIEEIQSNELVSVLAYDHQRRCQVKLKATASFHHQDNIAEKHWDELDGGKDSYNSKDIPGKQKDSLKETQQMKDEIDSRYFAVITLKVIEAEVLQLHKQGHIRVLYDLTTGTATYLVP